MPVDPHLDPLIVGCWQLDDRSWASIPESDIERSIDTYLALGIRTFDTADIYGRSESLLGQLLKGRDDCTILTKAVFFDGNPSPSHIRHKIENSLRNLKRERLDCVQVHWQDPRHDCAPVFDHLRHLQEQGKINRISLTNFNTPMLQRALELAPIWTHQVQYNLIDRRVEESMQDLCQQHHIDLLAYGPLAGGYLSDKFQSLHHQPREGSHARGFYYSSMIEAHGGWIPLQQMLNTLSSIAYQLHKPISQIALNWVRQQPGIRAILSGLTLDRAQIQSNCEALTWTLPPDALTALTQQATRLFIQKGDIYSHERSHDILQSSTTT